MLSRRIALLMLGPFFFLQNVQAQFSMPADWSMLPDPEAQQFEDPYLDLSQSQFESLMALARLRIAISGDLTAPERSTWQVRASEIARDLQAQGIDADWILAQREAVAARRQRAALSTNPSLDHKSIEITGYLLAAPDMENGTMLAFLLPDRGVCMHLSPPVPNQLIRLDIEELPQPLGPCIYASVRGRLWSGETAATVPVFDHTARLRSGWRLEVSEAVTAGSLSPVDTNFPAEDEL